uniref:Protein-glucosylgalactosylhydroxylysine glucosidase n=1 Tax=Crassostrea virginica TaxID=6565 RepID=A0A8B8E3C3_CRAVI|nr:protein-glucosylgalactosylhydroxylysine glucosidase-like [Crassostrea virginica]
MLQKIFLGNVLFNLWCLLSTVHVVQNSKCPENGHPVVSKNGITLVHGDITKTDSQENGRVWAANPSVTVLSNDTIPRDPRVLPTIGNGHIATVVKTSTLCMNGLYNGYAIKTHRALLPAILIRNVSIDVDVTSNYSLDIQNGMFVESHTGQNFLVTLKMYAHRSLPQLMVTELLVRNDQDVPLRVDLGSEAPTVTDDLDEKVSGDKTTASDKDRRIFFGRIKEFEYSWNETRNVTMVYSPIPPTVCVGPRQRLARVFLLSVDSHPHIAEEQFTEGVELFFENSLESQHIQAWQELWDTGRIDVAGDEELATLTYSSLYYILSSLPLSENPDFIGLSPGDLAHGLMYNGHVFWDQETWMYPPIQLLHNRIGKAIIRTRTRTLDNAKHQAMMRGFRGAMYPWESAFSGYDVTPVPPYFQFEKHITGDIAFAVRQYLYLSRDMDFLLHERGNEMIREIADFWASRVVWNKRTNLYDIYDVMPPDEYHHQVNNSAYTNLVAKISLELPEFVGGLLGQQTKPLYKEVARKMNIPFDETQRYHPEYDGYQQGEKVKQADVILMGFPLMMSMPEDVRKNDLHIYENATPGGPAMTWGMFAIGHLELNDTLEAGRLFKKQTGNVAAPYNVWTENADGTGAVNFITGMGGFLQSVLFGYGGFRLHPDRIEFQGRLPPSTNSFNVTGLDYLGGSIDFSFLEDISIVKLTKRAKYPLKLKYDDSKVVQLVENEEQTITAQRAFIVPDFPPLPTKTTSASSDSRNAAVGNSLTLVRISLYLFIMTMFVME